MQQVIEKKLTGAILGITLGTKTLSDAEKWLNKLRKINPFIAADFEPKLQAALVKIKK